ncbi:MAG TPA: hypothetical protein VLW06_04810 [Terriglobales bacterium]|nr:hypothetical protein [Terriglobales bacterium]
MKTVRVAGLSIILLTTLNLLAQSPAQKSFDLMKSLSGAWEGKDQMGNLVAVSYRMTGGGSALMSEINTSKPGHSEDMISMIHMDGDRLLLTHYCMAGNQPRMQATISADGKSITFDFVDATNLTEAQPGHMQRVIFTFTDASHHTEEWHFAAPGKEMVERFELERKG